MNIDGYTIIKTLLAKEHVTMTKLVEIMGEKIGKKYSINNLSNKLKKNTIKYAEMMHIAEILGYEIEYKKKPIQK